jgi:hypothetical protein
MVARDGKLRETDCADFMIMIALIQYLPMQYRRQPMVGSAGSDLCGVYTILNNIAQDQYIGSGMNIIERFAQHRSLLHRGKHYAERLQDAWNVYGEDAFSIDGP